MPAERAADVLAALDGDLQIEVARRLVDLDETDADVLAEVETRTGGLARRADARRSPPRGRPVGTEQHSRRGQPPSQAAPAGQPARVATDNWQARSRSARSDAYVLPTSSRSTPRSLSVVLHHADADIMALALAGARPEFAERALRLFPADEAQSCADRSFELRAVALERRRGGPAPAGGIDRTVANTWRHRTRRARPFERRRVIVCR